MQMLLFFSRIRLFRRRVINVRVTIYALNPHAVLS